MEGSMLASLGLDALVVKLAMSPLRRTGRGEWQTGNRGRSGQMAQGQATKEECRATEEAVEEIMKAFPKSKVGEFFGHFNDIMLFLAACKKALPSEKK